MNPIMIRSRNQIVRASLDAVERRRVQMLTSSMPPSAPNQESHEDTKKAKKRDDGMMR